MKERTANPFPPVADEHARVLILGSLPSEASRKAGFYYMHPHNRFWRVISRLLGENYVGMTAEEKAAALRSHGVALSDVVASCEIRRSADASIKSVECTDIPSILAKAKIERILLNGQKAYALFLRYFPELREIAIPLPSTSPANARSSLDDLVVAWGAALSPIINRKVD